MKKLWIYVVVSAAFWALAGYTLSSFLDSLQRHCDLANAETGLAAECAAPAAVAYASLFAGLFLLDLIRLALMVSAERNRANLAERR